MRMIKRLFNKLVVIVLGGGLWVYYRLGLGGSRRGEIERLLNEIHTKLYGTSY